ncbi:MAG TPA: tetratricopeptide repeat protein [Chthoniobacterales bacterium]|nr:tetratricopeptide repeat protein [Chthoniobacterales bacterium]
MNFFSELKRRNVYKVAIAYAVVGWLLIQIATQVFPFFEIPNWVVRLVVLLIIVGFPIALIIAWAFELTPGGIMRTEAADRVPAAPRKTHTWLYLVVICGAFSAALFFLGRYTASNHENTSGRLAKSIAVLPFENLSPDKDNAYLAEGIQDEILTRLAKIGQLKVISRTSTAKYQSGPDNLREIAQQLGVGNILEGSVQKARDQVRVNVQLIDATNDAHLWADSFDRRLTDIFALESEIAKAVADSLQAKLTGSEAHALAVHPTEDPEAHRLYLLGRFFWNKRTGPDFRKAIGYFQQAIDKDPGYALAYAGLADAYVLLSGYSAATPKESLPEAKAAAQKALELDESLGEAHAALAEAIFAYDFDVAGASREFRRALELNPNYATAHQWYAESALASQGRFDEAVAEMRRALELDPLSVVINADVGTILCTARRYDEAIEQLRKTVEMDPAFYYAHWNLGQALELKGQLKEARAEYEKAITLSDDPLPRAFLAELCAKTGQKEKAREILAELRRVPKDTYVSPYNFALIYIGLGEKDEALRELENTYEDRDGYSIVFIKVDPMLDPLRGDPRFEALVEKTGRPFAAAQSGTNGRIDRATFALCRVELTGANPFSDVSRGPGGKQ